MSKKILFALLCCTLLSSCSVVMAAKKSGHSLNEVQSANTRAQVMSIAESVLSSERNSDGQLIETYRIQKERGSAARAIMHGILDLSTCGLWEVVGTPIEGTIGAKEVFAIKVIYNSQERVERIELL